MKLKLLGKLGYYLFRRYPYTMIWMAVWMIGALYLIIREGAWPAAIFLAIPISILPAVFKFFRNKSKKQKELTLEELLMIYLGNN